MQNQDRIIVGWREWVQLPQTKGRAFRAKVDTGAKTSALHAHDLQIIEDDEGQLAQFQTRGRKGWVPAPLFPVCAIRDIRSSNGGMEQRPVIKLDLQIGPHCWPIEVTLTDRSDMQYDMLIGREALSGRVLVQPEKSYLIGKRPQP
ncbi:ATP-dependent zinc protease family protein [Halovulum sp. GXIMD14793]